MNENLLWKILSAYSLSRVGCQKSNPHCLLQAWSEVLWNEGNFSQPDCPPRTSMYYRAISRNAELELFSQISAKVNENKEKGIEIADQGGEDLGGSWFSMPFPNTTCDPCLTTSINYIMNQQRVSRRSGLWAAQPVLWPQFYLALSKGQGRRALTEV